MNEINITISGEHAVGKSTIMCLIGKILDNAGFIVNYANDDDYDSTELMLQKLQDIDTIEVIDIIKQKSYLTLNTQYVKQTTIASKVIGMTFLHAEMYLNDNKFYIYKNSVDGIFNKPDNIKHDRVCVNINKGIIQSAFIG